MMNSRNPAPKTSALTREARNTLLSALFVAIVSFIALALSVFEDLAIGKAALTINNLLIVTPLVAALAGIILSRSRSHRASILISVSITISTLGTTFIVSGLGILLATITAIAVVAISTLTLPARLLNRMVILGAVAGMLIAFTDLFLPFERSGPGFAIASALPFVTLGVFLGFAAFIGWQFRNYSIRSKLTITFVGLSVISAASIAFFVDRSIRASLTQETGRQLHNIAVSQGATVGNALAQQVKVLSAFSVSRDVENRLQIANVQAIYSSDDPAEIVAALEKLDQQWQTAVAAGGEAATTSSLVWSKLNDRSITELNQFQGNFPELLGVLYTDRHGGLVATTYLSSDYYQGDEEWWQSAYNAGAGGMYIGQPEQDPSLNIAAFTIAVSIRERTRVQQEIVGVLTSVVAVESLHKSLTGSLEEGGAHIDLLFPNNQTLGESGDSETTLDTATVAQLRSNTEIHATQTLDGEPVVFSTAAVTSDDPVVGALINELGWTILVHQSQAAAFAPIDDVTRTTVLVSLIVIAAAAILASLFAQFLSRPILQLTDVAAKVSAGDLTARAPAQSEDEIGSLARTFNKTTAQLGELIGLLEQRVAERTRAIALSSEVSRRLSGILDQSHLIGEVVEQIQSAFNYYHVHVYLFDEKREHLVMAGGTGEAARIMLARGHRLERSRGLVGRTADTNLAVLVPDVTQDPNWLPNPLLPDTKAELAVPIATGDQVLGVLDVQQNILGGLRQEDVDVMQSLANQVAVALQNARAFASAQKFAEREALINAINQQILGATTVETAMQIAAREVGRAAGAPRVSVKLKAGHSNGGKRKT